MVLRKKMKKGKAPLPSQDIKGTYSPHDITVDVDPGHLTEVVFVWFLPCMYFSLLLSIQYFSEASPWAQPTLKE